MAVLNVRLGAEEQRLVSELREEGVEVSSVVRDAIRAEHARRVGVRRGVTKPSSIVRALIEAHPAPGKARSRRPDPRDRLAVQAFIAASLRKAPSRR